MRRIRRSRPWERRRLAGTRAKRATKMPARRPPHPRGQARSQEGRVHRHNENRCMPGSLRSGSSPSGVFSPKSAMRRNDNRRLRLPALDVRAACAHRERDTRAGQETPRNGERRRRAARGCHGERRGDDSERANLRRRRRRVCRRRGDGRHHEGRPRTRGAPDARAAPRIPHRRRLRRSVRRGVRRSRAGRGI